jgi:hypothetical protein
MILFLLPKSPKFHDLLCFFDLLLFLQVTEKAKYTVLSFLVYDTGHWTSSFFMCITFTAAHCKFLKKLNLLC